MKQIFHIFINSLKRSCLQLVQRRFMLLMMTAMPLFCAWFMLDLMKSGAIERAPVALIDLDNSSLSRNLQRNLAAMQGLHITEEFDSFHDAMRALQRGDVLGFFYIPPRLEQRTLAGEHPLVSYYINYAYFAPASQQLKGYKTVSLLANGSIAMTTIEATGLVGGHNIMSVLQPVLTHVHGISNPWMNYSYYLNMSFVPCLLALFVLLATATSIGNELKYNTTREWLDSAGGSMWIALTGKLLPHTVVFVAVGWLVQCLMFRVYGLPLHGNPWNMILAMLLFVPACQAFAVAMFCFAPNYRYGATLCTLMGMLSFSFCGFSLPGEAMYPIINAVGYIMPVRHYFLISADQALNGIDIYFSRWHYAILIIYLLLPLPMLWRLKHECKNPLYLP